MSHLTPVSSSGLITIATGMMFFKPLAGNSYEELGICEPCTIKPEFEDQEAYDPRSGVRILAERDTTKSKATITITAKMLTARVRALGWASDLTYENQASATAATKTFTNVVVGGIYDIGKLDISNVSATDGNSSPHTYMLGTHFEFDAEAGLVRIIAQPASADTNLIVTYDNAAHLTAAQRPRLGIASNPDLRGAFMCRGTNVVGVRQLVKIPLAVFRPSGEINLSTEDYTEVEITGEALADSTQPAGEELGVVQTLT